MENWYFAAGTGIGKSHIDMNKPNQDNYKYSGSDDQQVYIAVVCDGAGSAARAEDGSKYFSESIADILSQLGNLLVAHNEQGKPAPSESQLQEYFTGKVDEIRNRLIQEGIEIRDYHSTVVGVVIIPVMNFGVCFQVGDSELLISNFDQIDANTVDYFYQLNLPNIAANETEYANETYFVTQHSWKEHLQIYVIEDLINVDMIAIMSDGCKDLVIEGGSVPPRVYRPFFSNLMYNVLLQESTEDRNHVVNLALENQATYSITGDDKTLVVLFSDKARQLKGYEPLMSNPESQSSNESVVSSAIENNSHQAVTSNLPVNNANSNASSLPDTVEPAIEDDDPIAKIVQENPVTNNQQTVQTHSNQQHSQQTNEAKFDKNNDLQDQNFKASKTAKAGLLILLLSALTGVAYTQFVEKKTTEESKETAQPVLEPKATDKQPPIQDKAATVEDVAEATATSQDKAVDDQDEPMPDEVKAEAGRKIIPLVKIDGKVNSEPLAVNTEQKSVSIYCSLPKSSTDVTKSCAINKNVKSFISYGQEKTPMAVFLTLDKNKCEKLSDQKVKLLEFDDTYHTYQCTYHIEYFFLKSVDKDQTTEFERPESLEIDINGVLKSNFNDAKADEKKENKKLIISYAMNDSLSKTSEDK